MTLYHRRRRRRNNNQRRRRRYQPLPQRRDVLDIEREILGSNNHNHNNQHHHQQDSYDYMIGSDESGVGAIAGPVVAVSCCCPVLPPLAASIDDGCDDSYYYCIPLDLVRDGKRLSLDQCRAVYEHVVRHGPRVCQWACSILTPQEIDDAYQKNNTSVQQLVVERAFGDSVPRLAQSIVAPQGQGGRTEDSSTNNNNNDDEKAPTSTTRFYSIVDGPKAPPSLSFTTNNVDNDNNAAIHIQSRPWRQADATVYTVALASCLARAVHHQHMQQLAAQRPATPAVRYELESHGGYPTGRHLQLLHQHGPQPGLHRFSCRPVAQRWRHEQNRQQKQQQQQQQRRSSITTNGTENSGTTTLTLQKSDDTNGIDNNEMDRKSFVLSTAAGLAATLMMVLQPQPASAAAAPMAGLPAPGEIEAIVPTDPDGWSDVDNPVNGISKPLARLDSSSDQIFYQEPRFVEHVDEQAVRLLTEYIGRIILQQSEQRSDRVCTVLDLCASWTSHIPPAAATKSRRVAGLGMNAAELRANPALTEWTVQDLNERPFSPLPYRDNSFDVILCQLSVDYLTQPLAVCRELLRVARNGSGTVHILFSNRLFLTKAVAPWTARDDVDRALLVASYLHYCTRTNAATSSATTDFWWDGIGARDLSVRDQRGRIVGDPLYVVTATKTSGTS